MAEEGDLIVIQQEFFSILEYQACVRRVRFVERSIAGYLFAQCGLDP